MRYFATEFDNTTICYLVLTEKESSWVKIPIPNHMPEWCNQQFYGLSSVDTQSRQVDAIDELVIASSASHQSSVDLFSAQLNKGSTHTHIYT